jgi:hypothetical protein
VRDVGGFTTSINPAALRDYHRDLDNFIRHFETGPHYADMKK